MEAIILGAFDRFGMAGFVIISLLLILGYMVHSLIEMLKGNRADLHDLKKTLYDQDILKDRGPKGERY